MNAPLTSATPIRIPDLPAPPLPEDGNLRDFPFMELDVRRLRDSTMAAVLSGDEFRAAVLLWCAAWHQVPAASLPGDDLSLSALVGYGRDAEGWALIRAGALRGWSLHADGRLYHRVVTEKALLALRRKDEHREFADHEKERKRREREDRARLFAELRAAGRIPPWNTTTGDLRAMAEQVQRATQDDTAKAAPPAKPAAPVVTGHAPVTHQSRLGQGQGQRQGQGQGEQGERAGAPATPPPPPPAQVTKEPEHHLVPTLRSLGLPTRDPEAVAQWEGLLSGPLVRASDAQTQVEALRWLVQRAVRNGVIVEYPRHVRPLLSAWQDHRAAQRRAASPATPATGDPPDPELQRRLRGDLTLSERALVASGRWRIGEQGQMVRNLPGNPATTTAGAAP